LESCRDHPQNAATPGVRRVTLVTGERATGRTRVEESRYLGSRAAAFKAKDFSLDSSGGTNSPAGAASSRAVGRVNPCTRRHRCIGGASKAVSYAVSFVLLRVVFAVSCYDTDAQDLA